MGLDQFRETDTAAGAARFRSFGQHEMEDQLNEWADQFQERFPEEVRIDFIEVSPQMTKCNGKAYSRKRDGERYQYIRIAEGRLSDSEEDLKLTLLHEMVHLYTYQKGYTNITERDPVFTWLLGRVGANVSRVGTYEDKWKDLAEPMLD